MTTLKYKPDKTVTKKIMHIYTNFWTLRHSIHGTLNLSASAESSKNIKIPSSHVSATLGGDKYLDGCYIQQVSGSYICQVSGSYIQQVSGGYKPQKNTIETNCIGRGHYKDVETLWLNRPRGHFSDNYGCQRFQQTAWISTSPFSHTLLQTL